MRSYKNIKIGVLTLVAGLVTMQLAAQIEIEAELTFSQSADNTISLMASISDTEEYDPVPDLEIEFLSSLDTAAKSLGIATTNEQGLAKIEGIPFSLLLLDVGHKFYVSIKVSENEDYLETSNEFTYQEVHINLIFEEIDSVKQIVAEVSSWDEQGEVIPVEEAEIYLYVPRLFGLLPIGDLYTDEDGKDMKAFPTDLPGNKNGELTVVSRIEDHELFGNVEISESINWGLPSNSNAAELPRALWSSRPPLWMIIAYVVLMAGVWGHYAWIIVNLFGIKSQGGGGDDILES